MTTYLPEGMRLHTMENQTALQSVAALQAAMYRKQILEARAIVCDAAHNLIVELPHMRGIIPREEGAIGIAEGTTREIALIAKAGKPVCFQVQELTTDTDGVPLAILSRRQAMLAGIFIALYPRRCPASSCDPHGEIRLFCRYWLWDSIYDSH